MVTQEKHEWREDFLTRDDHNKISCDWVEMDSLRRSAGNPKIVWSGEFELPEIGDSIVTGSNPKIGVVVDYGIKFINKTFERALWVKLDNGEFIKNTGKECKPVTEKEIKKIKLQNEKFKNRLQNAGKKVERQRKERRQRQVKGSHLLETMMDSAKAFKIEEKSSYYKITGSTKGRTVYVAIKGGKMHISGFEMDHPAIKSLTEQQARDRHLGRVRGELNFDIGDDLAIDAYHQALKMLNK